VSKLSADVQTRIEAFAPNRHDRAGFDCGVDAVDNFFRQTASKLNRANNTRVFVLCGDTSPELIGFYAINAHSVDYQDLPKRFARARPRHGHIPAAYISMIGVDQRHAGHGWGGDLLVDALIRIAGASKQIGLAVVMMDVLDCGDAALTDKRLSLYMRYGFQALPSHKLRLFMPVETIRKLLM
jgi:GNAT superfamily N-acetyltransferase